MPDTSEALRLHAQHQGKFETGLKVPLETRRDLSLAYSPGVAEPCMEIYRQQQKVYDYTAKGNMVAVVSDGSAVLGLGNIGAAASIPVMEGKAALFKRFAGIDAVPICLDTQDTEEIIETVSRLAPCFGGINLEDISSPRCFEIERRLEDMLDIPVFHDDQHGTAIVVTAALINALQLTGKHMADIRVVVNGPGAAGTAIIRMLLDAGVQSVTACDEHGMLYPGRAQMPPHKQALAAATNPAGRRGALADAVQGADVFIGVSVARAFTKGMVLEMAQEPIVFALANPEPEISWADAMDAGVAIMGTGRSDYPNQINNVLAFPGLFKGALAARARDITPAMKLAAAKAIAAAVPQGKLAPEYIVPDVFDGRVADALAGAVWEAAQVQ